MRPSVSKGCQKRHVETITNTTGEPDHRMSLGQPLGRKLRRREVLVIAAVRYEHGVGSLTQATSYELGRNSGNNVGGSQ